MRTDKDKNTLFNDLLQNNSSCLTLDQFIAYSQHKLTPEERFDVEKHLIDCELCSEAVEKFEVYPDKTKFKAWVKKTNRAFVKDNIHIQKTYYWRPVYSIAAILCLAAVSIFLLLNRKPKHEVLFAAYFQPYDVVIPMTRGDKPEGPLQQALVFYEKAEYQKALFAFEKALEKDTQNTDIHFYAGMSLLCLDNPDDAIHHLQKVLNSDITKFKEHGLWYTGLAYLNKNELEKARSIFQEIADSQWFNWEQSIQILKKLD